MDEIVWIRPADFDPTISLGSVIRPDASLPTFEVLDRRQVVMMFRVDAKWEVRAFTQLTLKLLLDGYSRGSGELTHKQVSGTRS